MTRKNPENNPAGKPIGSERARELAAMRRTLSGGRNGGAPRSDKPRCACGEMTLKRALRRGHDCNDPRSHQRKEDL